MNRLLNGMTQAFSDDGRFARILNFRAARGMQMDTKEYIERPKKPLLQADGYGNDS